MDNYELDISYHDIIPPKCPFCLSIISDARNYIGRDSQLEYNCSLKIKAMSLLDGTRRTYHGPVILDSETLERRAKNNIKFEIMILHSCMNTEYGQNLFSLTDVGFV